MRKATRTFTAFGETKTLVEWLKDPRVSSHLTYPKLLHRIFRAKGLTPEEIIQRGPECKRTTLHLTAFGETKPIKEWVLDARCINEMSYATLAARAKEGCMTPEEMLTVPLMRQSHTPFSERRLAAFGEEKTLGEWLKDDRLGRGLTLQTLKMRYMQEGLTPEEIISMPFNKRKEKAKKDPVSKWIASFMEKKRLQHGYTFGFIAGEIGMTYPTYYAKEKGASCFTFSEIVSLCKIYGVSLAEIEKHMPK